MTKPLVLLDANALRYCFVKPDRPAAELERIRKTMLALAERGEVRFIFCDAVAQELTSVFVDKNDVAYYEQLIDFYVSLGRPWSLRHSGARKPLELQRRRRLKHREVFQAVTESDLAKLKDPTEIQRVYAEQRQSKNEELTEEPHKRVDTVADLTAASPNWKVELHDAAEKNWRKTVAWNVEWEVTQDMKELGMTWPKHTPLVHEALPT